MQRSSSHATQKNPKGQSAASTQAAYGHCVNPCPELNSHHLEIKKRLDVIQHYRKKIARMAQLQVAEVVGHGLPRRQECITRQAHGRSRCAMSGSTCRPANGCGSRSTSRRPVPCTVGSPTSWIATVESRRNTSTTACAVWAHQARGGCACILPRDCHDIRVHGDR